MKYKVEMSKTKIIFVLCIVFIIYMAITFTMDTSQKKDINTIEVTKSNSFKIISSTENKNIEPILKKYASENNIDLQIDYAGTIEIMEKLNNKEQYDAVWCSNSIWLYMLNKDIKISDSKSTSINPVIFGIKKSKAKELGFIGKEVYTKDILEAINQKKLKFNMASPTRTNTGATAYLGFVTTLAGNPEVLKENDLENEKLKEELIDLYSGVNRSSGSEEFLEEMFLKGNYEAVVTYESSIININKQLEKIGKEPLYIVYPKDGVSISDSPFAYIDNKNSYKKEQFKKLQEFILSKEGQEKLLKMGRRVWFGGINENVDKTIFNPDWGIDTTKYIVPVKYPSKTIIKKALGIYQTELRKPINIVFCLDYSGSMYGRGNRQLVSAMEYILDEEKASKDLLQFSKKDKITIIPFTNKILGTYSTNNGTETKKLISKVKQLDANGGTDIYTPAMVALQILKEENMEEYNTSIVLMTDGESNTYKADQLKMMYEKVKKDIPIFSIMFGSASERQLKEIALFSNAKVFDGRINLLEAFKQVRGYN